MIECGRQPAGRRVAVLTGGTQLTLVDILSGMTGVAIERGALENCIDMTASARGSGVQAGQFEAGCIVVKSGRQPACRCMANLTGRAHLSLVRIILCMTRKTILRGLLEMREGAGAGVALSAVQPGMQAG